VATTKPGEFKVAFAIKEEDLRTLDGIFREVGEQNQAAQARISEAEKHSEKYAAERMREVARYRYKIKCSDKATRDFNTLEELLRYPNAKERRIVSLTAETNYARPTNLSIKFDSSRDYLPIEYSVSGDEGMVLATAAKLDDVISNTKAWYSVIRYFPWQYLWVIPGGFLGWFFTGLLPYDKSNPPPPEIKEHLGYILISGFIVFCLLVLTAYASNKLFPLGQFCIGGGLERYRGFGSIQSIIFVGLVLALIVAVVGAIIAEKILAFL